MKLVYFAWMRERIGAGSEEWSTEAETPRALIAELSAREPRYAAAFEDMSAVRIAINQKVAELDDSLAGAYEVAFFPPVTGG